MRRFDVYHQVAPGAVRRITVRARNRAGAVRQALAAGVSFDLIVSIV